MNLLCQLLIFGVLFSYSSVRADSKTIMCYYDNELHYSPEEPGFTVEDIDTNVCTHLVYCKICLDIETNKIIKDSATFNQGNGNENAIGLKVKNPKLKMLVTLKLLQSTWGETQLQLMANSSYVDTLATNIVEFLQRSNFDGVSFKFYPIEYEKIGFTNLIIALRKAFLPHGYLLVFVDEIYQDRSNEGYDFPSLSQNLDFLVSETYNFHLSRKEPNQADHHAPLYNRPWDTENHTAVDFVVNHWISKGFPPEKLLVGIPLWGNTWELSSYEPIPPAPAIRPGPYISSVPTISTDENSFMMAYSEICFAIETKHWQAFQDSDKIMGPYAVSPEEYNKNIIWVGYDDPDMAVIKSEYIISKGLGGAAVVDISYDDFRNRCGGGRNPMLTAIRNTLTPNWTSSSPKISIPYLLLFVIEFLLLSYFQVV